MNKQFKKIFAGTATAKTFGFLREALFLVYLSDNILYSEILSLLVISSFVMSLSDSSFLNPVFYPIWKENNNEKVVFNANHLSLIILFSFSFFLFNEITLKLDQPLYVKLICSVLWVPLVLHGIGYSSLLYRKQFVKYNLMLNIIAFAFLASFWILKDFGPESYIISRGLSVILGAVIVLLFCKGNFSIEYKFRLPDYSNTLMLLIRFLNVNSFIICVFIIRFVVSQIFIVEVAKLNYALVIVFIFYTLINKNLNALTIIEKKQSQLRARKIQIQFMSIFIFILILSLLILNFLPPQQFPYIDMVLISEIIKTAICFIPCILLCGTSDLYNSEKILQLSTSFQRKNLVVIFVSAIGFLIPFYLLNA